MHFSNLATFTTLLFTTQHVSALNGARIWTHFYPACSVDGITPGYSSLMSPQADIRSGVCHEVPTPLSDDAKVSSLSVDAEALIAEAGTHCNVTVHEVPGCIDPPLVTASIRDGRAHSGCVERNFVTYSAVWVRLDCGQAKEELPSAGSDGEGEFQEQEEPRFVKRDSVVRRRMSYYA
ncbi:hypothetical protein Plec18167_002420 [Paecilomyces lecythidis]|uniref:Uncharacterized protein n=1 Tax=Paecilomyces lecythidis TaxID=3004212 RepID=A0ABR3Y542_9EURO